MRGQVRSVIGCTLGLLLCASGCGRTPAAPADTPVDTPVNTPQANRNPEITSMTVTPLSVLGVTVTQMSAIATDADNDPFTYQWSFSGGTASGNAPEEPAVAVITQTGATLTGSVTFSTSWCVGDIARGSVDDVKGTIDANGVVSAPLIYIDDNNTDFKRFGLKVTLDPTGLSAAGDFSYWTLGAVFYVVGGSKATMIRQ